MKNPFKMLEDTFAAVAFAEAGEADTAISVLRGPTAKFKRIEEMKTTVNVTIEDLASMAVTFAEAGQLETAEALMKEAEKNMSELKRSYQKMFTQRQYNPA